MDSSPCKKTRIDDEAKAPSTTSTSTTADRPTKDDSFEQVSQKIQTLIKQRKPQTIANVPPTIHPLPPFINKDDWTILGDNIKQAEQPGMTSIPGDKWISLRCDGTGFSKFLPKLKKEGILPPQGYSTEFADIMCQCCQTLMKKFHAKCGYTQSDELTVLIAPQNVVRGVQQPHHYNGRIQKLCSLAAATVTATFTHAILMSCHQHNIELSVDNLATFDCRVGVYESQEQAFSLLFWRAYDCGINATGDAVYKSGLEGCKKVIERSNPDRIQWLHAKGLLPLSSHQNNGTFYVHRKRLLKTVNRKTGQDVTCLRSRIEQVEGNVLTLFQQGQLIPSDEVMPC